MITKMVLPVITYTKSVYPYLRSILVIYIATYRIAGKFNGENVWQIYSFQAFGGKKFGE